MKKREKKKNERAISCSSFVSLGAWPPTLPPRRENTKSSGNPPRISIKPVSLLVLPNFACSLRIHLSLSWFWRTSPHPVPLTQWLTPAPAHTTGHHRAQCVYGNASLVPRPRPLLGKDVLFRIFISMGAARLSLTRCFYTATHTATNSYPIGPSGPIIHE